MLKDYIQQDVFGNWNQIKDSLIIKTLYSPLAQSDWSSVYFLLNVQSIDIVKIPSDYKNVVISFHTEYYDYYLLMDFFKKFSDCNFLLLSDGILHENIWPSNVTYITWISYGYQLELANKIHGHSEQVTGRTSIVSSLSYRHEFHKAAVTAYLVNEYSSDDYILSWHDQQLGDIYYRNENFDNHVRIKQYLYGDKFSQLGIIKLDSFKNTPIDNGNWMIPAYLNCQFNLTNESIYNIEFECGKYTTPYLTEKTWKPLLAAQPFLPVGQAGTFRYLTDLGLVFDYGLDLTYDQCQQDYDRMEKLFTLLDQLKHSKQNQLAQQSADYNLDMIVSGKFSKRCVEYNIQQLNKIAEWLDAK